MEYCSMHDILQKGINMQEASTNGFYGVGVYNGLFRFFVVRHVKCIKAKEKLHADSNFLRLNSATSEPITGKGMSAEAELARSCITTHTHITYTHTQQQHKCSPRAQRTTKESNETKNRDQQQQQRKNPRG
mmetsp:Transcript_24909/g.40811  ORF Transcript_24909/g.40811 Transcript_24909/m.40811 type:complete len:131 (-) Transcript_24909:75-467(-)